MVKTSAVNVKSAAMPEYGDVVRTTRKLQRDYEGHDVLIWKETKCSIEGVFLGTRTIYEGKIIYDYDYDGGSSFSRTNQLTAALVSPGPRQNPVYVPLKSLEVRHQGVLGHCKEHRYLKEDKLMITPDKPQPTYDDLQQAWTRAIELQDEGAAFSATLQELRDLRDAKTTWYGVRENELRWALNDYLDHWQ